MITYLSYVCYNSLHERGNIETGRFTFFQVSMNHLDNEILLINYHYILIIVTFIINPLKKDRFRRVLSKTTIIRLFKDGPAPFSG